VETLPQELGSLQLTGEPVVVQRKKKPSGADRSTRGNKKKRMLPHMPMEDWVLEAPTVANRSLGLMLILGVAVAQRELSPVGTPQNAHSQVKRTKQKQKETSYDT